MSDEAVALLGLLAAEERLRAVAALALGARTTAEVSAAAGLPAKEAARALSRLASGSLVVRDGDGWRLRSGRFGEVARAAAPAEEDDGVTAPSDDRVTAAVLRAFFRGGRLTAIPVQHGKRLVVLDRLASVFEPGRQYQEKEVNAALRAFHDDYAALRRYLVDEGFLARDAGVYWRTGGTVQL